MTDPPDAKQPPAGIFAAVFPASVLGSGAWLAQFAINAAEFEGVVEVP